MNYNEIKMADHIFVGTKAELFKKIFIKQDLSREYWLDLSEEETDERYWKQPYYHCWFLFYDFKNNHRFIVCCEYRKLDTNVWEYSVREEIGFLSPIYAIDCPLFFLRMAKHRVSKEFRQKVREWHSKNKKQSLEQECKIKSWCTYNIHFWNDERDDFIYGSFDAPDGFSAERIAKDFNIKGYKKSTTSWTWNKPSEHPHIYKVMKQYNEK